LVLDLTPFYNSDYIYDKENRPGHEDDNYTPPNYTGIEDNETEDEEDFYAHEKDAYFYLDQKESPGPLHSSDLLTTRGYGFTIGFLHDFSASRILQSTLTSYRD
jgi:hypothetical protein